MTAVDARVVSEEGRQPVVAGPVEEAVGAALADRGEVGDRDGDLVDAGDVHGAPSVVRWQDSSDIVPRVIGAEEWEVIERGVVQRVTALNRFLEDLYVGEQACVHDRVVPRWLLRTAEADVRRLRAQLDEAVGGERA